MAGEFWLSEAQWGAIEPLLRKNQPGARRTDDRRVISGIVHVLKTGCRWQDYPAVCGPSTTVYNRFRRWTICGIWVACLKRWSAPIPAMVKPSTVRRPRPTARRRAEKGGTGAGDWPLAGRPHHKNPRHRRCARTPHRRRSDAWPSRRRSSRDSVEQRSSGRRLLDPSTPRTTAMVCAAFFSNAARFRSSRTIRPAKDMILSTRLPIANAISSSACSAPSSMETHRHKLAANFDAAVMLAAVWSQCLIDEYARFSASVSVEDFGDGARRLLRST
jgi:transposase